MKMEIDSGPVDEACRLTSNNQRLVLNRFKKIMKVKIGLRKVLCLPDRGRPAGLALCGRFGFLLVGMLIGIGGTHGLFVNTSSLSFGLVSLTFLSHSLNFFSFSYKQSSSRYYNTQKFLKSLNWKPRSGFSKYEAAKRLRESYNLNLIFTFLKPLRACFYRKAATRLPSNKGVIRGRKERNCFFEPVLTVFGNGSNSSFDYQIHSRVVNTRGTRVKVAFQSQQWKRIAGIATWHVSSSLDLKLKISSEQDKRINVEKAKLWALLFQILLYIPCFNIPVFSDS